MAFSGLAAVGIAVFLAAWIAFLCAMSWRAFKSNPHRNQTRSRATAAGLVLASVALLATLTLDLSWLSVNISQRMTFSIVRVIAMLIFWPSLLGFFLCIYGIGRVRFLGIVTCLLTGFWWFTLSMGSAISMGALPVARHPVKYLIPDGYVGWVKIKRGENAPPLPLEDGKYICRIPSNGIMATSTLAENGWATDEYLYGGNQKNFKRLRETSWGGGGMIWGGMTEFSSVPAGSQPTHMTENFFVGTEDQYHQSTEPNGGLGFK